MMTDIPFDIQAFLLDCANADETPEALMENYGEDLDAADIYGVLLTLADFHGYSTTHAFLQGEMKLARDLIDATQSNPDQAWELVWKIALLDEVNSD